jgi:hypothetical protein
MTWIAACSGQRGIYQEVIMTDEERQKLCAALRNKSDDWLPERLRTDVRDIAADEIERLAALAQSNAKPVAWQYRVKQGGWGGWHDAVPSREEAELCVELGRKASGGHLDDYEIRPLYAAPPRPDASAGLIEAVAKAICSVRYNDPEKRMPICEENSDGPPIWTSFTQHARAAIEAMHPDASAGLIEAAEWHEQEALRFAASPYTSDKMRGMMHKEDARKLRACVADRSAK